jgi:Porin PorA
MRKTIPVLFGLGGFLLIAGLVCLLWAPGVVKKTPLDVNTTTHLSGQAAKLNTSTGELESNPVLATSVTKSDSKTSSDKVVAWTNSSCLVVDKDNPPDCVDGDDPRLVSASTDVFATDRKTALAVNDSKYLPADAVPHHGLVNKFPFDTEKKTYPYWDGTLGAAADAKYDGTEKVGGVDTYRYKININDAPIEVADGVKGTYTNEVVIWVEPKTGAIQNQSQDQQRYLEDGTQVLNLQAQFTPAQITQSAADTEDNLRLLSLVTVVAPLVGFIGGVICLLAALVLFLMGRSRPEAPSHSTRERETTGV